LKLTQKKESGCENTSQAYKFFAEPGYLHNVKVAYPQDVVRVKPPHTLEAYITTASKALKRPMFLYCWCWRILPSYHSVALLSASL
ncbi:hypothetical protein pdam_00023383, partial [Pocillopora damicornis]